MHNQMNSIKFSVLIISFCILQFTYSERLQEQIYSSIEGGAACFRRLNGTHQAGCTSPNKGAVGVVHMISELSDAQWLVEKGSAGPYVGVVSTADFHKALELLLNNPDNVAGVLVYDNATSHADVFSQESRCPNEYYSAPNSQCSSSQKGGIVWNDPGTGLIRQDIPFPIFYVPESRYEEIQKIQQCYESYNLDKANQAGRPLCSVQLHSFMYAAVNTEVCMRRSSASALLTANKVCDPLGDHNVYYSLFPRIKETKKKKVTLVTARIDTASLFDGVAPGAASSVVGMVAFITAASTLSKMIPVNDSQLYDNNILWTLFNGEAFDYIGSQRVAYDISRGSWPPGAPLTPSDLKLHVELGQLGGALLARKDVASWPLSAFAAANNQIPLTEFLVILSRNAGTYNWTITPKFADNTPPSSIHSFRRILDNVTSTGDLPEVLLVDHEETFSNKYYHSVLDVYDTIAFRYHNISIGSDGTFISTDDLIANGTMKTNETQVKIARLATTVARTLYQQVTGRAYVGDLAASAHLVDEMLYCFLKSPTCRLLIAADFMQNGGEETQSMPPAPLYVGVASWPSPPSLYAGHLLALLTGNHLPVNKTVCYKNNNTDYTYYWFKGWNHTGICVETTMNFSQALSPAFTIPNYDYTSGVYSTWTESVWQTMWARVFVAAGGGGAKTAAAAGAVTTVIAAIATVWLKKHSSVIFKDSSGVSPDAAAGILRSVNC